MLLASIDISDLKYASDYESYCLFNSFISAKQITGVIKRWKEDYRSRRNKALIYFGFLPIFMMKLIPYRIIDSWKFIIYEIFLRQ
jgi:hypothetical protein